MRKKNPNVLSLATLLLAALLPMVAQDRTPSTTVKPIKFDVISVKPNQTNTSHPGSMIRSDGFDAENIAPIWVMYWAFDCGIDRDSRHFSGLPGWVNTERFDIIAKVADADVPTWKRLPNSEKERMVRDVLAERFKLSFHREAHEQSVYALVVAKGGPKMAPVVVPESDHVYGTDGYVGPNSGGIGGKHARIKTLVDFLNGQRLGREVVDRTGLTGNYDFMLKFAPFPMDSLPDDAADPSGSPYPYIFAALQEQLGLKLESTKRPVDVIVIDHIEKPTEN